MRRFKGMSFTGLPACRNGAHLQFALSDLLLNEERSEDLARARSSSLLAVTDPGFDDLATPAG